LGCTVEKLKVEMSATEFQEWIAYADTNDPLLDLQADEKNDLRTGVIGATIANCLAVGKKRFAPSDFAPKWGTAAPKKRQSGKEMIAAAQRIAAASRKRK
jgi:hypothetical protein